MTKEFTPTEELIIEVLVARHRLGEQVWSMDSRNKAAVERLEKRGLLSWKNASIENYLLVWLSPVGKKEFLSLPYIPPIANGSKKVTARAKKITKRASN